MIKFSKIPQAIKPKVNQNKNEELISPTQKYDLFESNLTPEFLNNLTLSNYILYFNTNNLKDDDFYIFLSKFCDKLELESKSEKYIISNIDGFYNMKKRISNENLKIKELSLEKISILLHINYLLPEIINDVYKLFNMYLLIINLFEKYHKNLNPYQRLNILTLLSSMANTDYKKYLEKDLEHLDRLDFLTYFKFINRLRNSKASLSSRIQILDFLLEPFISLSFKENYLNKVQAYVLVSHFSNQIHIYDLEKVFELYEKHLFDMNKLSGDENMQINCLFLLIEGLRFNKRIIPSNIYDKLFGLLIKDNKINDIVSPDIIFKLISNLNFIEYQFENKQLEILYLYSLNNIKKEDKKQYILNICIIMEKFKLYNDMLLYSILRTVEFNILNFRVNLEYFEPFKNIVNARLGEKAFDNLIKNLINKFSTSNLNQQIHILSLLTFFDKNTNNYKKMFVEIINSLKKHDNQSFKFCLNLLMFMSIYIQDTMNHEFSNKLIDTLLDIINENFIEKIECDNTMFKVFLEICSLKVFNDPDIEHKIKKRLNFLMNLRIFKVSFFYRLNFQTEIQLYINNITLSNLLYYIKILLSDAYYIRNEKNISEFIIRSVFNIRMNYPKLDKNILQEILLELEIYREINKIEILNIDKRTTIQIYKMFKKNDLNSKCVDQAYISIMNQEDLCDPDLVEIKKLIPKGYLNLI